MEHSNTSEQEIPLVENDQDDVLLMRRVQAVTSGMDAIAYLKGDAPFGGTGTVSLRTFGKGLAKMRRKHKNMKHKQNTKDPLYAV